MAGRYRINRETRRSRFYMLLSVIFIVVMYKWGIPFFVSVIAGKGSVLINQEQDVIPPQSPVLSALPEATGSASILVEGYTESGAALDLMVNDAVSQTSKAEADGSFAIYGMLSMGPNRVYVRAADEAGNISSSEVKLVSFDNKPVVLTVLSPKDSSEFFGGNNQVIDITGEVNKANSQVVINNSFVVLDKEGKFTHRFQLADGNNEIKIVASDRAGNTDEMVIKILYTP